MHVGGLPEVLAVLVELASWRVTPSLLRDTAAGKIVKGYTQNPDESIANAAKIVVKAWKQLVLQTQ